LQLQAQSAIREVRAGHCVGPLGERSSKNRYILTCQDERNKFMVAIPIEPQDAETRERLTVEYTAKIRHTKANPDRPRVSSVFKETSKLLRNKKIQCSEFHPESNGDLREATEC